MAKIKSAFLYTKNFYIFYGCIVFSSFLVYSNKASEIRRPRGVSLSKASLYIPENDFTCFDGSASIPFQQVNDDYCDCLDGSDEPGTSACPNSFFHCTNAGHRPRYIPSSKVNDGICDCCDGTDEYSNKVHCENNCNEIGRAARLEAQKQVEITKQGNEIRLELSKKGKQLKQEKQDQLNQLEKDKQEAENLKLEKETLKTQAEELENLALEQYRKIEQEQQERLQEEERKASEQEAFEIFNHLDSNQDRKIQIPELQVRQTFDQNKDGVVSEEEAKFFLDGAEEIDWGTFVISAWPKMKPFYMMEKGLFKPPQAAEEQEEGVGTVEDVTDQYHQEHPVDTEPNVSENEEEEEEEEEDEEEEHETEDNEPEQEVEQTTPTPPKYDPETQKLVETANKARSEYDEADRELRDIQREISHIQESLDKDYGLDEEFAPLEGECFEYTDREYKYKLCPFDQASQQPRSGGTETRLGVWNRWAGPENDKYQAMLYDKGQSCWNGPQRSTFVKLSCGIENAIIVVSEPSKCEYKFEFATPAACRSTEGLDERPHDEL